MFYSVRLIHEQWQLSWLLRRSSEILVPFLPLALFRFLDSLLFLFLAVSGVLSPLAAPTFCPAATPWLLSPRRLQGLQGAPLQETSRRPPLANLSHSPPQTTLQLNQPIYYKYFYITIVAPLIAIAPPIFVPPKHFTTFTKTFAILGYPRSMSFYYSIIVVILLSSIDINLIPQKC